MRLILEQKRNLGAGPSIYLSICRAIYRSKYKVIYLSLHIYGSVSGIGTRDLDPANYRYIRSLIGVEVQEEGVKQSVKNEVHRR